MRKQVTVSVRFAAFLVAGSTVIPLALAAQPAPTPLRSPQRMEKEGPAELRAEYFALRRQAPGQKDFNAAKARLQAIAMRERQIMARAKSPLMLGTTWSFIGPAPISGGQTPGNGSARSNVTGRITAIAFSGSTVWIGTAMGGVWTSADSGTTWTEVPGPPFQSIAIGAITIDPSNPSTVYVGTGEDNYTLDGYFGVGVYKSTTGGATWTGPLNTEVGTGNDIFTGRSIGSIVVDRTSSSRVFACSGNGFGGISHVPPKGTLPRRGVYQSTNGGTTWVNATGPIGGDFRCSNMIQDPVRPTWFWAAMAQSGLPTGNTTFNGGLLVTNDSGTTWFQVADAPGPLYPWPTPTPTPQYKLPANSGVANQSWNRAWVAAAAANGDSDSTIYVGIGMANQPDSSSNLPPDFGWPAAPTPKPAATPVAGLGPGRIYRSTDSGKNWDLLTAEYGYCDPQCDYDLPVYTVPGHPALVFAGGAGSDSTNLGTTPPTVGMFRSSSNKGDAWADMITGSSTAVHADFHIVAAEPGSSTNIWAGNDGGIWRTTGGAGGSWTNKNNPGLSATQFIKIDTHPILSGIVYGGTQDNGTNSWGGLTTWTHSDDGDGGYALISRFNPNNVAHTYYNITNDQIGPSFATTGTTSLPSAYSRVIGYCAKCAPGNVDQTNGINAADRVLFYAPMVFDKGSGIVQETLYFGTNKLYKASSFFTNAALAVANPAQPVFTDISGGVDLGGTTGAISAIAPVPNGASEAQIIFVGNSQGDVNRTTNGGANWTPLTASGSIYISDIAIDPTTTASLATMVLYTAESGFEPSPNRNVWKSTDGGNNWAQSASGLPNIPINALVVDPVVHTRVWAATDIGVYLSQDSGGTWNPYTNGMPTVPVYDLKPSASGDQIFAATHGRGVYRLNPLTPVLLESFTAD